MGFAECGQRARLREQAEDAAARLYTRAIGLGAVSASGVGGTPSQAVPSLTLALPRRSFTPAQRAQSHPFWARKAAEAAKAADARRRQREAERHTKNTDILRNVAINPQVGEEVLRKSKESRRAELADLERGAASGKPPRSARSGSRAGVIPSGVTRPRA